MKRNIFVISFVFLFFCMISATISNAESPVCEINGAGYTTLQEALNAVETGETIKLLNNIQHKATIEVNNKNITFDLNGFTLEVTISTADAIVVGSLGVLSIDDSDGGELNAAGGVRGVYAHNGGQATVTNATRLVGDGYGEESSAAYAESYGRITVKEDAIGNGSHSFGAYADNYGWISIGGNATGIYTGVRGSYHGTVIVGGHATGNYCGAWAIYSKFVEVYGNAVGISLGAEGVEATDDSKVIVHGSVYGFQTGVRSVESTVIIDGDCRTTSTYCGDGVLADLFSTVTVKGDVYGREEGIFAINASVITVGGNVSSNFSAVYIGSNGQLQINGNVSSSSKGIEVSSGVVRVNGTVSAPTYVIVSGQTMSAANGVIDTNYYKFNKNMANVYIKIPPVINGVSSEKSYIVSSGGECPISVSGINMTDNVIVAVFDDETPIITGSAIGTTSSKTVTLSFPPAEDGAMSDKTYTIKASLDGGITWASATDTVVLHHAPVLVTTITVASEGGKTTVLTGNSLQVTAEVTPHDADYTNVIWSIEPGTGNATINSSGLLTGTGDGTVTVKATASDGTGIEGSLEITILTKPVISGTVTILGTAKFAETLTCDVSGITYTPDTEADDYTIQWKRGGSNIPGATNSTYTLIQADIGAIITVTVSADGQDATGSLSASTSPVEKLDGPEKPAPPTLSSKTHNRIYLVDLPGMAYKRDGDSNWYAYAEFTSLAANTTYKFYAKVMSTSTRKESLPSDPLLVTTDPMPFHNVTYYPNDGAATPVIINSIQEGTSFALAPANSFTPPFDRKFKQWNTKADGTGSGYSAGYTRTMPSSGLEFYAIWERATYTVTYDANGGTGTTPTESDKQSGETFDAASNTFIAPVERKFKEWNTHSVGDGDGYDEEETISMPFAPMYLYAIWEKITYPVTYHANGGSGVAPIESDKAKDDTFLSAASNSFTPPADKKFKEWNTKADEKGNGYAAVEMITMPSGGLELYAIWELQEYPVIYEIVTKTGAVHIETFYPYGQSFATKVADEFTPPDEMRFKEWNTKSDGSGDGYEALEELTMPSGGITLYGIWEVITYSVTYHANNWSTDTMRVSDIAKGETFDAVENTFIPGFEQRFKKWNTESDGTGDSYIPGATVTMPSGGIDLYAQWEAIPHTVTYFGNGHTGGSVPVDSNTYTYYSHYFILLPGDMTKSGYVFRGWNSEPDGTGTRYIEGYSYSMEMQDITLYAQWEPYVSGDFTDPNFKQAVWEWLGNPEGSTPGDFTKSELKANMFPFKLLYAENKGITSLAGIDHFFDLGLEHLYLRGNYLTSLPALPDSLKFLYCGNNLLTSLPELPNGLEFFYCNDNQLTELPNLPDSLRYFKCYNNELTNLPPLPGSLISLECFGNRLESLPALPEGLETLYAYNNNLGHLPALPSTLKELVCSNNKLTSLPALPESLDSLRCNRNLLTGLPELPSGLSSLFCDENFMDFTSEPLKTILDQCDAYKYYTPQLSYLTRTHEIEMVMGSNYDFAEQMYEKSIYSTYYLESEIEDVSKFSFISSDTNVALVDAEGVITAVGDGNCTITALYLGYNSEYTRIEVDITAYTLYNIVYHANGGTGTPPATVQKRAGTTFETEEHSLIPPEGKRLKEWNTKADGSGDSYLPQVLYTMPAEELSLYAIWEVIPTYTVTYDGNGNTSGSPPVDTNRYYEDDSIILPGPGDLIKSGYVFRGWYISSDERVYQPGRRIRVWNENIVLYAYWDTIITNDFTDTNFRQAVWEWLGNPAGSTPGDFTEMDLVISARENRGELDVSARGIKSLSGFEHFAECDLRFFICNNNEITDIPGLPHHLTALICNDNKLSNLPALPDGFMGLDCSNNRLTSLPDLPEGMGALVCANNFLDELPQIPDSMGFLIFSDNFIQQASRPDIEKIKEIEESVLIAYPQYRISSELEELKINEGKRYALADAFYVQSYDGIAWSEKLVIDDLSPFTFISSNPNVAKVNNQGFVIGTGGGTCQISALIGNNDSPYTKVTFSIAVTPKPKRSSAGTDIFKYALTLDQATRSIDQATSEAGQGSGGNAVISLDSLSDENAFEVTMPKAGASLFAESEVDSLLISSPLASIKFSYDAITTIANEAAGEVKIAASRVEKAVLSEEIKNIVGDRPVYNFSVTSEGRTISQFNGRVTVSVPYELKEGEDPESIIIFYINADGVPELVSNCSYDAKTGMVSFSTSHFSQYAVGYNKIAFKDVAENAWYGKAVNFIASRGITSGIGNGCFGPEVNLTRGQFIVLVMKAYGIAPDENSADNFSDAGNAHYTGYLAAARRLGISAGIGNNRFGPEREITRQEMFAMLYTTLKVIGRLPTPTTDKVLDDFSDEYQIAPYAREAMLLFLRAGVITGSGERLNPAGVTNRAQLVQVLYTLLK